MTSRSKVALWLLGLFATAALATTGSGEVLFRSLESKTIQDGPVFNRIKFFPGWNRDIWMMNQSHKGLNIPAGGWERLAIVVDKAKGTAQFYQLPPGALEWNENLPARALPYRVSCFICHSNGPRAVRPDSGEPSLSILGKLTIAWWNLRIRTYGRIREAPEQISTDARLHVPFRLRKPLDNEELQVKACSKCHNEEKRGALTRQNAITIQFMIDKGLMPPKGAHLTPKEHAAIAAFTLGL